MGLSFSPSPEVVYDSKQTQIPVNRRENRDIQRAGCISLGVDLTAGDVRARDRQHRRPRGRFIYRKERSATEETKENMTDLMREKMTLEKGGS